MLLIRNHLTTVTVWILCLIMLDLHADCRQTKGLIKTVLACNCDVIRTWSEGLFTVYFLLELTSQICCFQTFLSISNRQKFFIPWSSSFSQFWINVMFILLQLSHSIRNLMVISSWYHDIKMILSCDHKLAAAITTCIGIETKLTWLNLGIKC